MDKSKKKTMDTNSVDDKFVKFFDFYDNRTTGIVTFPVNWEELLRECNTGVLKDAKIFKYLFGLDKPIYCKKISSSFSFNNYYITFNDWSLFLKFIRFGKCDSYKVNDLRYLCDKFGGIPYFNRYYKNLNKIDHVKKDKYNPMFPKEDVRNLYHWRVVDGGVHLNDYYSSGVDTDYSVAGIKKYGTISQNIYFRKLKTNINNVYDDMHDFRKDILNE